MRLVNGIKEARLKKEVKQLLSVLSPQSLTHKNLRIVLDRYRELGCITEEQHKVIETKLIGTKLCLMVEAMFKKYNLDVLAEIVFYDGVLDTSDDSITMYHVAGPNLPESWVEVVDGYRLDEWEKYYLFEKDEITLVPDVNESDFLNPSCLELCKEHNMTSAIYLPLFYGSERIGNILVISEKRIDCLPTDLRKELKKNRHKLEGEYARLQNEWFNIRIKGFRGVVGLDDTIRYVEDRVKDVLGFEPDSKMRGKARADFIHPDDHWYFYKEQMRVVNNKEKRHMIYRAKTIDGDWVVLEGECEPVLQDGKVEAIRFEAFTNTKKCQEYARKLKDSVQNCLAILVWGIPFFEVMSPLMGNVINIV